MVMRNSTKIVPLAALVAILVSLAPMASASTLTVDLNPQTQVAKVDSLSTTKIVFTYPADSVIAKYLENVSSSNSLNSSFTGGTGVQELQDSFDGEDNSVAVHNMTVALSYSSKGNATALVISKKTNVTSWVTGVFKVVNGTVHADLGWRAYVVRGPMNLDMHDRTVDINMVGSTVQDSLAAHAFALGFILNAFGTSGVWNSPTMNFTALNTPLSTWTKTYNSGANTTTFTKTIAGESTFSASFSENGQDYTLSEVSDPTGVIAVSGYANAQANSLVIAPAPAASPSILAAGAAIAIAAAAAAGSLYFRSRKPGPVGSATLPA
ncbi:MAG: hypothetical protein JRN38_05285 [Nitrososphaerota archaeon]|nr:hypothetical protein [Nitrososphaerota archaeon]